MHFGIMLPLTSTRSHGILEVGHWASSTKKRTTLDNGRVAHRNALRRRHAVESCVDVVVRGYGQML